MFASSTIWQFAAVEAADRYDRFGDLLAISSDVLNWRAADRSGDAAKTFNAGETSLHAISHKLVPTFARRCGDRAVVIRRSAAKLDTYHKAVKAPVRRQDVAAAAKDKYREVVRSRKLKALNDRIFRIGMK